MNQHITAFVILGEAAEWEEIRKKNLESQIQTLEDYQRAARAGVARAQAYLEKCKTALSLEEVRVAHFMMFHGIYKDAGDLRKEGSERVVEGREGSPGEEVKNDLKLLGLRAEKKFLGKGIEEGVEEGREKRVEERIEAACFYHTGLDTIQPFEFGNGPLGRLVLCHQLDKEFSEKKAFWREIDATNKEIYRVGLERARALKEEKDKPLEELKNFVIDVTNRSHEVEAERIARAEREAIAELQRRSQETITH